MRSVKRFGTAALFFMLMTSWAVAAAEPAARQSSKDGGTLSAAASPTTATREPIRISDGPYLQSPLENAMTVVWRTNHPAVSEVEYRAGGNESWSRAIASRHGLRDIGALHVVRIEGLKPGVTYGYRAVSKEIASYKPYAVGFGDEVRSEESQFTTLNAEKKSCAFVVSNDRHEKIGPFAAALKSVRWDGVDLAVLNGDMLNYFESEPQAFTAVVAPCVEAFAKTIPFLYVRGNHEARGLLARQLMDYFPTPSGQYYYAFTHGAVRFVVLDSGEDKPDASKEYSGLVDFDRYRAEQTEWLKREIRSRAFRRAAFRIVFVHMPFNVLSKESNQNYGREYVHDHWLPLFNEGKIDLMISGHTHRLSRHGPEKGKWSFPILVGATNTVIRGDVAGDRLKLTVTGDDGTKKDELRVMRRLPWWRRAF